MVSYLLQYYSGLMGVRPQGHRPFDLTGRAGLEFQGELKHLDDQITKIKIRNALNDMPKDKASGPDGFPTKFYQRYWEIIKSDIIAVIRAF